MKCHSSRLVHLVPSQVAPGVLPFCVVTQIASSMLEWTVVTSCTGEKAYPAAIATTANNTKGIISLFM